MRSGFLVVAMFLLGTAGCYRVRPLWRPEAFLARAKPALVHVRQRNRPVISIVNPQLTGDTLRGTGLSGETVAVAWSDVMDVYARRFDGTRTAFAVFSMTLLSGLTVYSFVQNSNGNFAAPCPFPVHAYEHENDRECMNP